ncbi:hypothetical protein ACHAXM_005577 [Skeletonema potamos]
MASTVTNLLVQVIILLSACFLRQTTCFCIHHRTLSPQNWKNNLQISHQPCDRGIKPNTALSLASQETTNNQWNYHKSCVSKNDDNDVEVIHGRYNAVITKTIDDVSIRWIGSFDPSTPTTTSQTTIHTNNSSSSSSPPPPTEAVQAIQATYRWADKFVRQLNLCPWAGSSIDKPGAICYWAVLIDGDEDEKIIFDKMEDIVREAGVQLVLATTSDDNEEEKDIGRIDPSVAISFIVLVPNNKNALPNFGNFHQFFINLEDRLLDECDDYWDTVDDDDDDDEEETKDNHVQNGNNPLGCEITIAAFHPEWQFNGSDDTTDGDAIDYEKRTPYPTISIVMSSVIDNLMKERDDDNGESTSSSSAPVTERIADLNEKTLCAIGVERLKEIFDEEVLRCPMNDKSEGVRSDG